MKTSTILIVLGVALAAIGVWWFFIRKKTTVTTATRSTFSPGPAPTYYRPPAPVAGAAAAPMPAPLGTPGGGKITTGAALEKGVSIAATAGCAAAAGAYTGGALLPLCGAAGPLAVSIGQGAVGGAKAVGGFVAGAFKSIF